MAGLRPLARYHLCWAIVIFAVTGVVFGFTVHQWLKEGRPPVYTMWFNQLIVVAGAYRVWYHFKAFNTARKS